MIEILLECLVFMSIGYGLRHFKPLGFEPEIVRKSIVSLVFVLFLPALVLKSLWSSPPELIQWQIPFSVAIGILVTGYITYFIYKHLTKDKPTLGAVVLAGSMTNAIYQGLPIVSNQLGELGTAIAIQYDFFAQTPILLSLGILLAKKWGHTEHIDANEHWFMTLLKVPALWAALLGLILNQSHIEPITPIFTWLDHLSAPVVPLMLLTIGLGLNLKSLKLKDIPFLMPVIAIKLFMLPLSIIAIGYYLHLSNDVLLGLALEGGMSSIVIAIVISERYHLNTGKYIEIITFTLLLSLLSLPLWQWLLPYIIDF
jgi:predicted permease